MTLAAGSAAAIALMATPPGLAQESRRGGSSTPQAASGAAPLPRTIDDCERYSEALAYNACLASFGPARRGGGAMVTTEVAKDGEGAQADAPGASERRKRRTGRQARTARSRGGRVSASFTVPGAIISGRTLRNR